MSLVEQLQQLSELHRAGALTDAQFESAKNSLLGQPTAPAPAPASAPAPAPASTAPVGLAAALQGLVAERSASEEDPSSLQARIDHAAPGATIEFPAGVYSEKLMITKDISIVAEGVVLRPPTPEMELSQHAERLAQVRHCDAQREPLEQAKRDLLAQLEAVGMFSFGKKSKLKAALEDAQAAIVDNRQEMNRLRKEIIDEVKRPLIEIKDARVSVKGLRMECPPEQAKALMSEEHWYALGADTEWKADLELRLKGNMLRASLSGPSHALSLESCTLDGGGMYGRGVSASSNKGNAALSLSEVEICNLGHEAAAQQRIDKDIWASIPVGIYIWWGLENKQTRVKLSSCRIHDVFSGIMIHKCSSAALTNIQMKSIATYGIRVHGKAGSEARGNMTLDGAVFTDVKKRSILGYTDASGKRNFTDKGVKLVRSGVQGTLGAAKKSTPAKAAAPAKKSAAKKPTPSKKSAAKKPVPSKRAAAKKPASRQGALEQASVSEAPLPCEVCGATIRGTQYYFHGGQFSDGWSRGFFCSTSCRQKAQEAQHFGSPHEPFRKGDRVRLMGDQPHFLMDEAYANAPMLSTAGNHGEFPGGTQATVVSDLMVVPEGGYSAGIYGDIDLPGKYAVVSIRINGIRYDGVYIGALELVKRG